MNNRPSRNDTEEDLLRLQREFLQGHFTPSVTLIKKSTDKRKSTKDSTKSTNHEKDIVSLDFPAKTSLTSAAPPEKRVKFKHESRAAQDRGIEDVEEAMEEHDTHITKVLTDIVEPNSSRGERKKSLFAQQFLKTSGKDFGVKTSKDAIAFTDVVMERDNTKRSTGNDQSFEPSRIISGSGLNSQSASEEATRIHEENVAMLGGLTQQQIRREQQQLLQQLDPSVIAFLKGMKSAARKAETLVSPETDTALAEKQESLVVSQDASEDLDKEAENVDLPVKPEKHWMNMSKIEYDKLEWTKNLPPPPTGDTSTGHTARFDFKGGLVVGGERSVHEGLHHHGAEPGRAGYSLDELFQLCRSTHLQQRVLSLNTLAHIINRARHGAYAGETSHALVPELLDGGLLFLLRWALDDSCDNSMAAAMRCIHALLVCEEDEAGLDFTFSWRRGHQTPAIRPAAPEPDETDAEDPDRPHETDANVIRRDIIEGLLRMSVLARLRYILSKCRPDAGVVVSVLHILTRIARHSSQAAYQITQCAGLLEVIVEEFLPMHWTPREEHTKTATHNYGYPLPSALKLMRVLCTTGRNIAANMISKYRLMDCITRYIGAGSDESLQLDTEEGLYLYAEAFRTWQICVSYGLSMTYYSGLYSILVSNLQSLLMRENRLVCALLLPLLESCVRVASSACLEASRRRAEHATQDAERPQTHDALPHIDWSQIAGLYQPARAQFDRDMQAFINDYFERKYDLVALSTQLNFLAAFISDSKQHPGYNSIEMTFEVENLMKTHLLPCIKTQAFALTLSYLREHSLLLYNEKSERENCPASLPECGALIGPTAKMCPLLEQRSTIHFIIAFTRLLITCAHAHKPVVEEVFKLVLEHEDMLQYVRKLCVSKTSVHAPNYFSKFENALQLNLITMARLLLGGFAQARIYHQLALQLLTRLHNGEESAAHELLSCAVFNESLLRDTLEESPQPNLHDALRIQEEQYLVSATQEPVRRARAELLRETGASIVSVRNTYLRSLAPHPYAIQQSRARREGQALVVASQLCGDVAQLLVPVDWSFLPLVTLYNKHSESEAVLPGSDVIQAVLNSLRWLHLLECKMPGALERVCGALRLSRLYCVFLAGSDLFLESNIHAYLLSLLKIYCKQAILDRMELEKPIPGLTSFYDLYIQLVQHYDSVSFGDSLFACYLLIPLQQRHLAKYRLAVWGEFSSVLAAITLPLDQVVVPVARLLMPEEQNVAMLRLYCQALLSGRVQGGRTPLPYVLAVHHLNRFLYTQHSQHVQLRRALLKQLLATQRKEMAKHVLHYKDYSPACVHGLQLYDTLPSQRQALLDHARADK